MKMNINLPNNIYLDCHWVDRLVEYTSQRYTHKQKNTYSQDVSLLWTHWYWLSIVPHNYIDPLPQWSSCERFCMDRDGVSTLQELPRRLPCVAAVPCIVPGGWASSLLMVVPLSRGPLYIYIGQIWCRCPTSQFHMFWNDLQFRLFCSFMSYI